MIEFEAWPKIQRFSKVNNVTLTEKIDGTNACVVIESLGVTPLSYAGQSDEQRVVQVDGQTYEVGAQSRNRLIWPGSDNAGFAGWVFDNAETLVRLLGHGRHYGEWWGQGIQSRYNMDRKVFSLFNSHRWTDAAPELRQALPGLDVVPVLYSGVFDNQAIEYHVTDLRLGGSKATVPYGVEFLKPEGVVIYHHGLRGYMKAFIENDDVPKGLQ